MYLHRWVWCGSQREGPNIEMAGERSEGGSERGGNGTARNKTTRSRDLRTSFALAGCSFFEFSAKARMSEGFFVFLAFLSFFPVALG